MECAFKSEHPAPHPRARAKSFPVPIGRIATEACNYNNLVNNNFALKLVSIIKM